MNFQQSLLIQKWGRLPAAQRVFVPLSTVIGSVSSAGVSIADHGRKYAALVLAALTQMTRRPTPNELRRSPGKIQTGCPIDRHRLSISYRTHGAAH